MLFRSVEFYLPMRAMYILINRGKQGATMSRKKKVSIPCSHNNAPSHRSKSMMKWFKESSILLLFHPPSSPDLSPIEPVWHKLKKVLQALPHLPTTVQELRAAILSVWDTLPIEDVDKHINRMHDHVEAILAAKGGHTRF